MKYNIKYKSTNAVGAEQIFDTYYSTTTNVVDSMEAILENTTFNHQMEVIDFCTDTGDIPFMPIPDDMMMGEYDQNVMDLNEAWYGTECTLIKVNIEITL
jgi:membrane-bound lytic murein transglycosylase